MRNAIRTCVRFGIKVSKQHCCRVARSAAVYDLPARNSAAIAKLHVKLIFLQNCCVRSGERATPTWNCDECVPCVSGQRAGTNVRMGSVSVLL